MNLKNVLCILLALFIFTPAIANAYQRNVPVWKYNKELQEYKKNFQKYSQTLYSCNKAIPNFNKVLKQRNELSIKVMPKEKMYRKLRNMMIRKLHPRTHQSPLLPPKRSLAVAYFNNAYFSGLHKRLPYKKFRYTRRGVSQSKYGDLVDAAEKLFNANKKLTEDCKDMFESHKKNMRDVPNLKKYLRIVTCKLNHLQLVWTNISPTKKLACKKSKCFIRNFHGLHYISDYKQLRNRKLKRLRAKTCK